MDSVPRIVLASTSRHRRMLMDRLGVAYETVAPRCDEHLPADLHPREATLELSLRKARSVGQVHPHALVIGSDQMAVLDGRVLGKPGTEERAVAQLLDLAGRSHELWTAVAVLDTRDGTVLTHAEVWRMTLGPLDRTSALEYVRADVPLDCAGSYRYEGRGAGLFESVEGEDPTAITGLPLRAVIRMLEKRGVSTGAAP